MVTGDPGQLIQAAVRLVEMEGKLEQENAPIQPLHMVALIVLLLDKNSKIVR